MNGEIRLTDRFFLDYGEAIETVLQRGVNHALLMHKRLGNPIATWEDGRVVIIPPEKIVISSDLPEDEVPRD